VKVKETMESLPKTVERLESKRKLHDMSAKVLVKIEQLEEQ